MKLAIAILNYEQPLATWECLESILTSIQDAVRIIVLDNGSTDDSVELIMKKFPDVEVVSIFPNRGFAGGMNAAIAECLRTPAVDRVLLVSNDTVFDSNAVRELMKSAWDVAIPKILYQQDRNRIWAAGARWRKFPPMVVIRGYQKLDSEKYERPVKLDFATGCVFLVKRSVLETIGGFDEAYQYYMEDYDFFDRIRRHGFSIGYVPTARIYHKVSLTLGHRSLTQFLYLGRNTVLFYRKNKRLSIFSLLSVLVWIIARELVRGNSSGVRAYLRGVSLGFQELKDKTHGARNQDL